MRRCLASAVLILFAGSCGRVAERQAVHELPLWDQATAGQNLEWMNEEIVLIDGYAGDAMEAGISRDGRFLLFNDNIEGNKDLHWASAASDYHFRYGGKVENTISDKVDGTPAFDGQGNLYFTSLARFPADPRTIYRTRFAEGVAIAPTPVDGNIYRGKEGVLSVWVSLDPDVTDDGEWLFYSEGQFKPGMRFPYPFNIRAARRAGDGYRKVDDALLANVNTAAMEYAPAISADALELYFSRIAKFNGKPAFVGIFSAKRTSADQGFGRPQRIMAISGEVEAPVLSGDEQHLYYHRKVDGVFRIYRVTRRPADRPGG